MENNDRIPKIRPVEEIAEELKMACNVNRYPMFLSIAKKGSEGIEYYNQCLNAALEVPEHITRISKLLLAVNDADIELPPHIQRAMSELSSFVEQYKISLKNVKLIDSDFSVEKFDDYMMVASGLAKAVVPKKLYGNEIEGKDLDDLDDFDDVFNV